MGKKGESDSKRPSIPFHPGKPKVNAIAPSSEEWGGHPSEGMASAFSRALVWVKPTSLARLLC